MTGRRSLRRVFGWQFALVAALPLLLAALLWGAAAVPQALQDVERDNQDLSALVRSQIETELALPQHTLQLTGRLLASLDDPPAEQAQHTRNLLQQMLVDTPAFEAAYLTDARGRIEAAAVRSGTGLQPDDLIGLDISSRSYYAQARAQHSPLWSDSFLSPFTGRVTAALVVPAGDGVLVADMSLDGLAQALHRHLRADTALIVLDREGRVIVHPQQQLANWQENLRRVPLLRRALQGLPARGSIEFDGRTWIAEAAPAPSAGWTVVVAQPRSRLYAPLARIGIIAAASVLVALAIAIAAGLRLASRMADRYRRLASAAQRMVEQGGGGQVEPVDFGTEETHALWQRLQALLEQMREQEQRALTARRDLQAVLDAATEVAIIATDSAGIIRLFNRGASKLLGWPAEAVVGSESVLRLHDPEELRARAEALREAGIPVPAVEPAAALTAVARSSGYEVRDWTCRRRDGSPLLVSMAVTALRDADGEPSGFLHIAIDQSSRQRALELEVERERAEAASRAKSDFLSRVSHELRTPLNAMLGYAQLMELDPTDPLSARQHERVSRIETAGWHLLKLIDDVLDLSRIEAGNLPLVTQAVELDEALRQALRLVAPQAEQHRVHLQAWDPPAGGPLRVQADPTRLTQVLVNLLSNAVKYNRPEGKVWVQARTTDAGEVAIQVYDTGRGIALERQSRLFAPFDRIGMENSGVPGTGLGLVITKRLVELMQGRIDVQSTPDEGSCFTVVLPLAHERSGAPAARALPPAASSEQPAVARDIVYVEDNPMNAALMREVLALRPGWRLHLSESCREGQALIERVQPQLVLVDVHLPDGNGQALIRWLRSHPRLHALPAVIVSADATEAQQEAGLGAGATAYLTKPVRIDTALQTLDALLTDAPPRPGGG